MVDPQTMNYLGIYQRAGKKNATLYFDWLASLLLLISTKSSVWYELHPHKQLDEYLVRHKARVRHYRSSTDNNYPNVVDLPATR